MNLEPTNQMMRGFLRRAILIERGDVCVFVLRQEKASKSSRKCNGSGGEDDDHGGGTVQCTGWYTHKDADDAAAAAAAVDMNGRSVWSMYIWEVVAVVILVVALQS